MSRRKRVIPGYTAANCGTLYTTHADAKAALGCGVPKERAQGNPLPGVFPLEHGANNCIGDFVNRDSLETVPLEGLEPVLPRFWLSRLHAHLGAFRPETIIPKNRSTSERSFVRSPRVGIKAGCGPGEFQCHSHRTSPRMQWEPRVLARTGGNR